MSDPHAYELVGGGGTGGGGDGGGGDGGGGAGDDVGGGAGAGEPVSHFCIIKIHNY